MYEEEHESDYEEGDYEVFSPSFKPSYIVIGIDTHPLMFQKNEDGIMPFRSCLEACYNLADRLIFMRDKRAWSPFAVMITGQSTPLISFDRNVLETIKVLKQKSVLPDSDLIKEFQRKGSLDLGNFFLTCKKIFHEVKSVFYKRVLIYLSNDDKPIVDRNAKFTALNEIKTFATSQIEFQIVPTVLNFNYKLFYNELYSILGSERYEEICTDTEGLTQKLSSSVLIKVNERKVLFYPFKGDTGRFMKCLRVFTFSSVSLYNSFMTKNGEKVVNTNVPGDSLPYFRIKFVNDEKGDNVRFDPVEKDSFQDFSLSKGYTLLYVADKQVGVGHIFTKPTLIKEDPKEELNFFKKFWDNCVANNKVLVCIAKMRQPDKIRYCELIPVVVDNTQMFLEKRLPYGTEIVLPFKRDYPDEEVNPKRRELVQQLVDQLTFDFDPKMIPDVTFQKKKAYVKAKLLNEPLEEVEDVEINHQQLDEVLEEVVANIKSNFDLEFEPKKRKAQSNYGNRNKKIK